MPRARVKVAIKATQKKGSGTLIARVPVAVSPVDKKDRKPIYQTKAQLNVHLYRGKRPSIFKSRRTGK